jgi:hypothetical protein
MLAVDLAALDERPPDPGSRQGWLTHGLPRERWSGDTPEQVLQVDTTVRVLVGDSIWVGRVIRRGKSFALLDRWGGGSMTVEFSGLDRAATIGPHSFREFRRVCQRQRAGRPAFVIGEMPEPDPEPEPEDDPDEPSPALRLARYDRRSWAFSGHARRVSDKVSGTPPPKQPEGKTLKVSNETAVCIARFAHEHGLTFREASDRLLSVACKRLAALAKYTRNKGIG